MNPGGLVLMTFAGIGIAQLFAGDALKRLKILPSSAGQTPASSSQGLTSRPAPDPGGGVTTPSGPLTSRPAPNPGTAPPNSGPLTSRPAPSGSG